MILSVGEILADMIGQKEDGVTTFKAFCGGAPFNLAVNAKQSGAKVGFVGRVGNDVIGRFVLCEAQKAHLDRLDIQIDAERNTTIAFVTPRTASAILLSTVTIRRTSISILTI